ncbi:hypothetical protein A5707_18395 [Mycobacterium kyorinense]|uniref:STAS domain-containing protein n=2 Tax=Mycobacterium kyorinense TaxID=487514 RepID=A0A1A2ZEI3_9MYCO|nr:hypothetical protein A5707_18395 [Mycobacterium kyorinense]
MSLSTHFQSDITAVEVRGVLDACGAARLSDYVIELANPGRPLIIDLSSVDFVGGQGFQAMIRFAQHCQQIGVQWALVANAAVSRLLRAMDSTDRLPIAADLKDARRLLALYHQTWAPTVSRHPAAVR